MEFESRQIEVTGVNTVRIHGDLTLHGVTRPIVLEATFNGGYAGHPMDPNARIGFSAQATLQAVGVRNRVWNSGAGNDHGCAVTRWLSSSKRNSRVRLWFRGEWLDSAVHIAIKFCLPQFMASRA